MNISAKEVMRDTALVVVPVIVGSFAFASPSADMSTDELIMLLSVMGGSTIAGWLFRKRHGIADAFLWIATRKGSWPRFEIHSIALTLSTSVLFAAFNLALAPSLAHQFAANFPIGVVLVLLPLALGIAWLKVNVAMTLGQWLYGRYHGL